MKKVSCLVLTVLLLLYAATSAMAQEPIKVMLDGQRVEFDVQPQIINEQTMVPFRAIFESLGASVDWNDATRTVSSTKDDTTISLTIDSDTMYVNDKAVTIDSPACIVGGRTLVPVRVVSEAFGVEVGWEGSIKMVLLSTTGEFVEADVKMYAVDGRTEVVCESEVSAWQSVGWNLSPVLSKADFLKKANGWWIDLNSCRLLWDEEYVLDFMNFSSDKIEIGSTYSEYFNYQLKQLKFVGNNTYNASIYMPGYWYGDEYYSPANFNWTITYDGQDSFSITFDGSKWYTYTFIGTNHDFESIQRHPYVINAAN